MNATLKSQQITDYAISLAPIICTSNFVVLTEHLKTGHLHVGGYDGFRILLGRGEKHANETDKNASWK
jgi:hypothetical protein